MTSPVRTHPGRVLYQDEFNAETGAPASIFMQWKGTDICGDFRCECGLQVHICDASFVYHVRCGGCGSLYQMPHTLPLRKVTEEGTSGCTYDVSPEDNDG
jgi:hypothetical protein